MKDVIFLKGTKIKVNAKERKNDMTVYYRIDGSYYNDKHKLTYWGYLEYEDGTIYRHWICDGDAGYLLTPAESINNLIEKTLLS